jgi:hypothetical protein
VREALRAAWRRLPESVRANLHPADAVEESASFLPSGPRLALLEAVRAYRSVSSAARQRGSLAVLEGVSRVDGAALRVAVDLQRDAEAYWSGLLFEGIPARRDVCELRGPFGFTRAALPDADLTVLRLHRFARRRARALGFLTVPAWVQTTLDTSRTPEAIAEGTRSGRSSRKNDIRRTKKAGFSAVLASGAAEVHHFFDEWCLPFTRTRFGAGAITMGRHWIRQVARICDVMWIEQAGARVGGALLEPRGRELRNLAFGVRDPAVVRDGVLSACYWLMIEHAVREGYRALQLGSSRPVLSDGVLRHKLKWGGVLTPVRQWDYFAIGVARDNPTARAILAAHPLIAENETDRFIAVTTGDTNSIHPNFGLEGLLTLATDGWTTNPLTSEEAA